MNECPQCHGAKLKIVTVPSKIHPNRMREEAVYCDCYITDRIERLFKTAQIPARYQHCTFENVEIVNQSISGAVSDIKHFVEYYPLEKTGLLLIGRPGIGKTHLAVAAIQYLIREKGIACIFCDYRELLKEIQNTYNASVQITELEILRPIFETEVLVLDELGAIRPSDWVWDTVSHILNYRYNEKKTTIITTNFTDGPSRLSEEAKKKPEPVSHSQRAADWAMRDETLADRITDRMYSRLHEMCRIIHIQGSDFRRVAAGFVVRVIPLRQTPTSGFVLQARSLQTGDYWSSPPLQWDEIYKYLHQMGQTELQIEDIESALQRGKAADITEKPVPMRVSDYLVRKMQMKPSPLTEK
jgi:DNA replication protein DnaC